MKRKWIWILAGWLAAAGLVSCGPVTATVATESALPEPDLSEEASPVPAGTLTPPWTVAPISPTQTTQKGPQMVSPTAPTPSNPAFQKLVRQAQEDLAQRLSIQADQIGLVEVRAVVWPDGGMGCPQPGMAYTQVQREGLFIRLRVGKRIYHYHSGGGSAPFLCEQSMTSDSPILPSESGDP